MYVISLSSGLTMPLRDTKTDYAPNGAVIKVHPAVSVQFHPGGGAPDWARDAVQKLPGFGRGVGLNEDPFTRVGVLDTVDEARNQNWDDETLEFVEQALLNSPSNGVQYCICYPPKIAKPWKTYDEFVGEDAVAKILYTVELTGASVADTIRYEKENLKRAEVIEALEAKLEEANADVVGVISA